MIEFDFPTADLDVILAQFLSNGVAVLRGFVDAEALSRAHGMVAEAYESTEGKHVYPSDLRRLGLPMYSDVLFGPRNVALLDRVFAGHPYEISVDTVARRVANDRPTEQWSRPLGPHMDSFIHNPAFTVNFWLPFQECGVTAPSLAAVAAPFDAMAAFCGYRDEEEVWAAPEDHPRRYGLYRPEMLALGRHDPVVFGELTEQFGQPIRPIYRPGDAMMLSNWTMHFTHSHPAMTGRRENLELRFRGSVSLDEVLREHGVARAANT